MRKTFVHRITTEIAGAFRFIPWMPKEAASNLEAIARHGDAVMGGAAVHLHERYSPDVHIDVLHYAPNSGRDFHYAVTSGMSDRAMATGKPEPAFARLELVMALPTHWDISATGFRDPAMWQPIKLLKQLARYPHANRTLLAKHHTVLLGDEPLLSPMKAVLLAEPILTPEFQEPLQLASGRAIHFLAPILIHEDELDVKLNSGLDRLLSRLAAMEVTELYNPRRPSVLS